MSSSRRPSIAAVEVRALLAICSSKSAILCQSIVASVENQLTNTRISLDSRSLLQSGGQIIRYLTEDTNLASNDFLFSASAHVAGHIVNESLLGSIIKNSLPKGARLVEVLGSDLGQESNSSADENTVSLIQIHLALLEGNGFDGGEIVWP